MTDDDPIAEQLAGLTLPAPSAARLHYAAGYAAGRRRARSWQLATAAAVVLAAAGRRPAGPPPTVDRVDVARVSPPVVAPPPLAAAADPMSVLRLREAVLSDATVHLPAEVGGMGRQPVVGAWMTEMPQPTD